MNAHEIDYHIYGEEMQYVEIELDPQEGVVAEAGSFMMMDDGIKMETIFGDGSQTRSFCYVDDQVEGVYRLLLSDYAHPVNIGNPHEISIKDFAEEIIKLTGTKQKVIYKDLPVNDPMQRQPDITLAKKLLGWEPKVDRAEGMKITYDYFKSLTEDELYKSEHKDFTNYTTK